MLQNYNMYIKHPWHGVDPEWDQHHLLGLIEISKGLKSKYEIDKLSGLLKLDRVLHTSFEYPINYGFIPQTLGEDGDPLDILVLSQINIVPLCLVRCYVIGVMHMIDRGKGDDKIIAVAASDPSVNEIKTLDQLPKYLEAELRHFFQQYTVLENKQVTVNDFKGIDDARRIINEAVDRYQTSGFDGSEL
ncbi:MAG: inorganic diphosphatase [Saprospiraceae bacterium]